MLALQFCDVFTEISQQPIFRMTLDSFRRRLRRNTGLILQHEFQNIEMTMQMQFLHGLVAMAFLFLALFCFFLPGRMPRRMPWAWFGVFALFNALHELLGIAANLLESTPELHLLEQSAFLFGHVVLLEFARRALKTQSRLRISAFWWVWLLPLAILLFTIYPSNFFTGLFSAACVFAGAWPLMICWKNRERQDCPMIALIIGLLVYGSGLLVFPHAHKDTPIFLEKYWPSHFVLLLSDLVRYISTVVMSVGLWVFITNVKFKKAELHSTRELHRFGGRLAGISILVLLIGWIATERVGRSAESELRTDLLSEAKMVAASIDHNLINAMEGNSRDLEKTQYKELRRRFTQVCNAQGFIRYLYLLKASDEGRLVFLVDTEPDSMADPEDPPLEPGYVYEEASPELRALAKSGTAFIEGPLPDKWGIWVSALVPVIDQDTAENLAVLGMDVDAAEWQRSLLFSRLGPTLTTLLVVLLIMVLFTANHGVRDTLARLRESESTYQSVMQGSPNVLMVLDHDGRIMNMNQNGRQAFDSDKKDFLEFWADAERGHAAKALQQAQAGILHRVELKQPHSEHQNKRVWYAAFSPVPDEDNGVERIIVILTDTSSRKMAEEAQAASLRFMEVVLDTIPSPVFYKDCKGHYLGCNQAFAETVLGVNRKKIIGKSIYGMPAKIPLAQRETFSMGDKELLENAGEQYHECSMICADDTEHHFCFFKRTFLDQQGQIGGIVAVMLDITARQKAERALRASEKRSTDIATSIGDWLWECDASFHMRYSSERVENLTGSPPHIVIGKNLFEILACNENTEKLQDFRESMESGENLRDFELSLLNKDGAHKWVRINAGPFYDEEGDFRGYRGACTDITEEKIRQKERRELERHILHVQKAESLQVMAGSIAHNFNNLLMSISGFIELSRENVEKKLGPDGSEITAFLNQANESAVKASRLSRLMLTYVGQGETTFTSVNVSEMIAKMQSVFEQLLPKQANLMVRTQTRNTTVNGDESQLQQMLCNLVSNAGEAMENTTGKVEIIMTAGFYSEEELECPYLDFSPRPGNYLTLLIRDNGHGFEAESMLRAFDPFYTTRFVGRGLGLSAVLGIVKNHRGSIQIDSRPGKGTDVRVYVPLLGDLSQKNQHSKDPKKTLHIRSAQTLRDLPGLVIVVDDRSGVRSVTEAMLHNLGATVRAMEDPYAALEVLERLSTRLVCAVVDLSMPRMDGIEFARLARELQPGLGIVMVSGYSGILLKKAAGKIPGAEVLTKPFSSDELGKSIKKAMTNISENSLNQTPSDLE